MAAPNGTSIPTLKLESAPSPQIKDEGADASPSPYMEEDDVYEDAGDLDFSHSQQQFWLSRIPKSLWELWASMPEDGEIEVGTIRVEGDSSDPKRVRFMLYYPSTIPYNSCAGQPEVESFTTISEAAQRVQPSPVQTGEIVTQTTEKCIRVFRERHARLQKKAHRDSG
jgi:TFIIF, beta subunit N-terminus